jgi:16S rRNA (guanine527-N7)-methyltransferase
MLDHMTSDRIRTLLVPFLGRTELSVWQIEQVSLHHELLLKWNAKVNLTAVRDPEQIVQRHFGESLFAGQQVFPDPGVSGSVADLGSGAGFPGIPVRIWAPRVALTLIESQQRKAVFLREVVRSLQLSGVEVLSARAETIKLQADVVTLRAVESFEAVLPIVAGLAKAGGRLALLIGRKQAAVVNSLLPGFSWSAPLPIPLSENRVLLQGRREG